MSKVLHILGIAYKPLTKEEEALLFRVPKIYCLKGTLKLFERYPQFEKVREKIVVFSRLHELITALKEGFEEVIVLASGDPLFCGIGETLLREFPKESIKIYPDLTTPQVLCAKVKIPFYKVKVISMHGRIFSEEEFLREVSSNPYLFIYTDPEKNPTFLALLLLEKGFENLILYVGEKLNYPDEKITSGSPKVISQKTFSEPNSLLIENPDWGRQSLLGLKEEEILHEKGMITKDPARAVILHQLEPPQRGVIWDIGAGSGSVSLELARLSPHLEIYAIEREKNCCKLIEKNCQKFFLPNVKIIEGEAPQVLKGLPFPDRVFVGGTGGKLKEILLYLEGLENLKIKVFSFVTFENLKIAIDFYREKPYKIDLLQLQTNRFSPLRDYHYLKPENPLFIFKVLRI